MMNKKLKKIRLVPVLSFLIFVWESLKSYDDGPIWFCDPLHSYIIVIMRGWLWLCVISNRKNDREKERLHFWEVKNYRKHLFSRTKRIVPHSFNYFVLSLCSICLTWKPMFVVFFCAMVPLILKVGRKKKKKRRDFWRVAVLDWKQTT